MRSAATPRRVRSTARPTAGATGPRQRNLAAEFPCAPCLRRECDFRGERGDESAVEPACFATLPPELVWEVLQEQMELGTH